MNTRRYLTIDSINQIPFNKVTEFTLNDFADDKSGFPQEDLEEVIKLQVNHHIKLIDGPHVIRIQ